MPKGISALQLGRGLGVQYKTAFVLAHKLHGAIGSGQADTTLSGHVEIEGAHFGCAVRQENRKADRRDRRRSENRSGGRQAVVVARERGGRALPFVFRSEGEAAPTKPAGTNRRKPPRPRRGATSALTRRSMQGYGHLRG